MMRKYAVGHGRDGWSLHVEDRPRWVEAVEIIGEWLVQRATFHRLCCGQPEWTWKVPLGRPRRDEDGWLDNSLGNALYALSSWPMQWAHSRTTQVGWLALSREDAYKLEPAWVEECEALFAEDESSTSSDSAT